MAIWWTLLKGAITVVKIRDHPNTTLGCTAKDRVLESNQIRAWEEARTDGHSIEIPKKITTKNQKLCPESDVESEDESPVIQKKCR
jgi:hypothetical protein